MVSRYIGNEGLCFDLSKVTTMCENDGTLQVIFDNGVTAHYNVTIEQTTDIIEYFKQYIWSLDK